MQMQHVPGGIRITVQERVSFMIGTLALDNLDAHICLIVVPFFSYHRPYPSLSIMFEAHGHDEHCTCYTCTFRVELLLFPSEGAANHTGARHEQDASQ